MVNGTGEQEMDLGTRNKKVGKIKLFLVMVFSLVCLCIVKYPKREDFIMTPSTHQQVIYMKVDNAKIDKDYKIGFALYDLECQQVQICVWLPLDDKKTMRTEDKNISICINGEEVETYKQIFGTTGWPRYVMYLLTNVEEGSQITFSYKGNVARMQ